MPEQGQAALLGHLLLATDPAAILRQGVLNLEGNGCTRIRSTCIKCIRNLLPQIGKGKMKQKSQFRSKISAKQQKLRLEPGRAHLTAKALSTNSCGPSWQNRNSSWGSCSPTQTSSVPETLQPAPCSHLLNGCVAAGQVLP